MTTAERDARNLARRAKRNNMNPADEIAALETIERRASRPALVSVGHRPKSVTLPKRPRKPVYSQGTRASRTALARWLRHYRAERAKDAARVAGGGRGVSPMSPQDYYAKWGHGDRILRQMAEEAARLEKVPNQQMRAPRYSGRPF